MSIFNIRFLSALNYMFEICIFLGMKEILVLRECKLLTFPELFISTKTVQLNKNLQHLSS